MHFDISKQAIQSPCLKHHAIDLIFTNKASAKSQFKVTQDVIVRLLMTVFNTDFNCLFVKQYKYIYLNLRFAFTDLSYRL